MTAREAVDSIMRAGGVLAVDGDRIRYKLPRDVWHLASILAERKAEVLEVLRRHGGRVAAFPHCPRCAGYALYRKDNIGAYECLTCGLPDIDENVARRMM